MQKVFPKKSSVKADWVTDLLALPTGKEVDNVRLGFLEAYDNYIFLEIDKGNLTREKRFKDSKAYEKYRERLFQAYKKTDEYKKMKEEAMKYMKESEFETQTKVFITYYISKLLAD